MENDINVVEKEIARVKDMAERHPFLNDEIVDNPPSRHWSDLPGEIRICFIKKCSGGKFYYHLSISAAEGRIIEDVLALVIMKMLNAPRKVKEVTDVNNECIRQFEWPAEVGQKH